MEVKAAYNEWANQYDLDENKTRDLEAIALREMLSNISFDSCLEIGCGTGKNTGWLLSKCNSITAIDIAEEMLLRARSKNFSKKVNFIQADITKTWSFVDSKYDLISFSLVLEHIEILDHVFSEASGKLSRGGYIYIGELHPFKQYTGTKARFENEKGVQTVTCFNHHITDFTASANKFGLAIEGLKEYFDDELSRFIPRILTILFRKI